MAVLLSSILVTFLTGCGSAATSNEGEFTDDGIPIVDVCDLETGEVMKLPADEIDTIRYVRDFDGCEVESSSSTLEILEEPSHGVESESTNEADQVNPYEDAPLDGAVPLLPEKGKVEAAREAFGFTIDDHEMTIRLELPAVFCRWVEEGGSQIPTDLIRMRDYALVVYEALYPSISEDEVLVAFNQDIHSEGCLENFLAIEASVDK